MQVPPPSVLALWPKPNYVNPESLAPANIIVFSVLVVLTTLMVAIRVYTRCFMTHGFSYDDWILLVAYAASMTFTCLGIYGGTNLQYGRHEWDVVPTMFEPGMKLNLALQITYDFATNAAKLSMLAMVLRVTRSADESIRFITSAAPPASSFTDEHRDEKQYARFAQRMAFAHFIAYMLAFVVIGTFISYLFAVLFQCRPLSLVWTLTTDAIQSAHCFDQFKNLIISGLINTTLDLALALFFPLPFWHMVLHNVALSNASKRTLSNSTNRTLESETNKKPRGPMAEALSRFASKIMSPSLSVLTLLVGGCLVVAAGCLRVYFTYLALSNPKGDTVWYMSPMLLMSVVELDISVIIASTPATRPFFNRFLFSRMR